VTKLKQLIALSIDNQQLYSQAVVRQLISKAVLTFSQNANADFNFMQVMEQILPSQHNYLTHFFGAAYHYYLHVHKDRHTIFSALKNAAARFSERLLDHIYHFILRYHIPLSDMPKVMQQTIEALDKVIRLEWLPCGATKNFPEIGEVCCGVSQKYHGNTHQSQLTYILQVPKDGFFGKLFGAKEKITQACRWEGAFDEMHLQVGWFVEPRVFCQTLTTENFLDRHKQFLESNSDFYSQLEPHCSNSCLACLMNFPAEVLPCKHTLCKTCCEELMENGVVQCPFCHMKGKWTYSEIPNGAAPRILTLGGVKSYTTAHAILLQNIEEKLSIPIHQLFDLIVATNSGTVSALGYGILKRPGNLVVAACTGINAIKM
jgi:hypothetical protein